MSQTLDAVLYKGQMMPEKNRFPVVLINKDDQVVARRLTTVECERLQGLPDNHTRINDKTADTPRLKAIGNSMAVPVMRWLGKRLQEATQR